MIPEHASAVTWLFVPGDRPERIDKAVASGADAVIVDLEDAVEPSRKAAARAHVQHVLGRPGAVCVRINAVGTPWHDDDIAAVSDTGCTVMLPKAEDPELVDQVAEQLGRPLVALVESAAGILSTPELARARGVARMALGNADLAADLGVDPSDHLALGHARSSLVLASAAAALPAPIDGVTLQLGDSESLAADVLHARRMGFGAKLCIHPSQLETVVTGLSPTEQELAWAHDVVARASSAGVQAVDGMMIDAPVLARARRLLASGQRRG